MQEVWDGLYRESAQAPVPRPSPANAGPDLIRSLALDKSRKYDVLRVFCAAA